MISVWNTRNPMHQWAGWLLLSGCIVFTVAVAERPTEIPEAHFPKSMFQGTRGLKGQWTEMLPRGEYTIFCESSEGDGKMIKLFGVKAKYTEAPLDSEPAETRRTLVWHITAPSASHDPSGEIDTIDGPLLIQVMDTKGALLGSGRSENSGPSLRREKDVWMGLAPLHWTHLDVLGKGEYYLPTGWRKEKDDRLVASNGPVVWNSLEDDFVRSIKAGSLDAKNVDEATLADVEATLMGDDAMGGGKILAEQMEVAGESLRFLAALTFEHNHGWHGSASGGTATRTLADASAGVVELSDFEATGVLVAKSAAGNVSSANVHKAKADRATWNVAGLRMEGSTKWDMDVLGKKGDSTNYVLTAPKTIYKRGPGEGLPEVMSPNSIRAEGGAVLAWNGNTILSPAMSYNVSNQTWRLEGAVSGTAPWGSFSAGKASGAVSNWECSGTIRADHHYWGTFQGDSLTWDGADEPTYIFLGKPVVLFGLGRRLTGEKIVQKGNSLLFPSGMQGNIAFQGEAFTLRADRVEIIGPPNAAPRVTKSADFRLSEIKLFGRVECSGQGYRFSSREALITFDGNRPAKVVAKGDATLQGNAGSGSGDTMELIFQRGETMPRVQWAGNVRGNHEVPIGR